MNTTALKHISLVRRIVRGGPCWLGIICLGSCALLNPAPSPYRSLGDTEQIYSIVFDSLAGKDRRGVRGDIIYPIVRGVSEEERARRERRITDSVWALPDSIRLCVRLVDTTITTRIWFCPPSNERLAEMAQYALRDVDQEFLPLVCVLDSLAKTPAPFRLEWIHSRYAWHIVSNRNPEHGRMVFVQPLVSFSRIAFDDQKTRACLYTQWHCGSLCGSDDFWFLEKHGAEWTLAKHVQLSVS